MLLTLLPYLTVVANLALVLGVLLGINQKVRRLSARSTKDEKAQQTESTRLTAEIAELKNRILELEESAKAARALPSTEPGVAIAAGATGNGINNTLRSKVLKMHRLGQPAERIAGSLRVPKGEVDLLVKVHKIVMRPYEEVVLSPLGGEVPEKS
jgi:hypothetical protein